MGEIGGEHIPGLLWRRLNKETVNKQCGWSYPLICCAPSSLGLHARPCSTAAHTSATCVTLSPSVTVRSHIGVLLTYHVNRFIVLMTKQWEGLFCFVCFFAFHFGLAEKSLDELFACCLLTDLWMFQWYCSSDLLFDQFRFHVNWCGEKNEIWYYSAISVAYFCWYTCDSLCKLTCLALPADISMALILLCKLMFSYSAVLLCSHAHSSG